MPWVARTEPQTRTAVDDRSPHPERHGHDPVLRAARAGGIEVVRARHAGEVGIEAPPVLGADDALDDHRHLLFLEAVGRHLQEGLGLLGEGRGVDALDRLDQLDQTLLRIRITVRQHVGAVNAGERLVG